MAGYDGWSMSNNARAAYDNGEMPASKFMALCGLSTDDVRGCATPSSWHHTSKKFNRTDFYSIENVCASYVEAHFSERKNKVIRRKLHRCLDVISPRVQRQFAERERAEIAEFKRRRLVGFAQEIEKAITPKTVLALPPDRRQNVDFLSPKQFHDYMLIGVINRYVDELRSVIGRQVRQDMKSQIRREFGIPTGF